MLKWVYKVLIINKIVVFLTPAILFIIQNTNIITGSKGLGTALVIYA